MNDRNLDQLLGAWMDLGPTAAPERVAEAARLETRSTRQTATLRGWPARRFHEMNNSAKLALAAAAVVVAAFLGIRFLVPGQDIGAPGPTPTLTPTPVAFPQPAALAPGAYFWDVDAGAESPLRFTFTVPDGWTNRNDIIRKDASWPSAAVAADRGEPGEVALGVWIVTNTYADPCHWQTSLLDPPVGPTVEDLATALMDQVGRNASVPTDVEVGGYSATRIELSVPADLDIATCDNGYYRDWLGEGESHSEDPIMDTFAGPTNVFFRTGQVNVVYLLDVEGARIVINTWHMPDASEAELAELEAVLASVRIEP